MTNFCLLLAAGKISTWLTPIWILGLGFAVGAAVLLLLWGICFAASRIQVVGSILDNPKQRRWVGASISGAVFVSAIVFIIWPQISEWRKEGVGEAAVNIPLALVCWAALSTVVGFSCVALVSRKTVTEVPTAVREGVLFPFAILVAVMGTFGIVATFFIPEEPGKIIDSLLQFPATSLEYPQVAAIPLTAFCVVTFFLLYIVQQALMPRLSAIALATAKSEIAQPLFLILTAVAAALMLAFVYIPFYTLGDDIKMMKDTSLTVMLVIGIFLAIWAASKSVAEEIEGRTALTVLSKPIGRRQFVLGKFLGISWTVALLFVILGVWLLIWVAYKPIYDARESGGGSVVWQACFSEIILIVPGVVLAFMEVIIFVALSIAISTRLPITANLLVCFSIYVLGHLTPLMVQSAVAVEAFEPVVFIGKLIAAVIPVLDHFNIQAAIAADREVPGVYLGWTLIYCLIYSTIAMLLALVFFEDRDLT